MRDLTAMQHSVMFRLLKINVLIHAHSHAPFPSKLFNAGQPITKVDMAEHSTSVMVVVDRAPKAGHRRVVNTGKLASLLGGPKQPVITFPIFFSDRLTHTPPA
jgi:hypothetical protein